MKADEDFLKNATPIERLAFPGRAIRSSRANSEGRRAPGIVPLLAGGALGAEKSVDAYKSEEKADGKDGSPGKPIPGGPVNHG